MLFVLWWLILLFIFVLGTVVFRAGCGFVICLFLDLLLACCGCLITAYLFWLCLYVCYDVLLDCL